MDVGSAVATPLDNAPEHKKQRVNFEDKHVDTLEQWIDGVPVSGPHTTHARVAPSSPRTNSLREATFVYTHSTRSTALDTVPGVLRLNAVTFNHRP